MKAIQVGYAAVSPANVDILPVPRPEIKNEMIVVWWRGSCIGLEVGDNLAHVTGISRQ